MTPLPISKFLPTGCREGFVPAPLDAVSLWNGVAKFFHDQHTLDAGAARYLEQYLDSLYPLLIVHSTLSTNDRISELFHSADHARKAAGYPFNQCGCSKKLEAFEHFGGVEGLLSIYAEDTTVIGSTLKDELRPSGKDARFFRPQDAASYAEGARLFDTQNIYLLSCILISPMFGQYQSPGVDLTHALWSLKDFGLLHDADGVRWDANLSLAICEFICWWRSRDHPDPKAVKEYYRRMYNGYTTVGGWLFNLKGNPSGHFLTSTDNSLAQMCLMALHAYKEGMSIPDFKQTVRYFCCGDDLVWADRSGKFNPVQLNQTYNAHGAYLEFSSIEPLDFFDLSFVSVHPRIRTYLQTSYSTYVYDPTRLRGKMSCFRKASNALDRLAKLVSYCQLAFGDEQLYAELYGRMMQWLEGAARAGQIDMLSQSVVGLLASCIPSALAVQYFNFE